MRDSIEKLEILPNGTTRSETEKTGRYFGGQHLVPHPRRKIGNIFHRTKIIFGSREVIVGPPATIRKWNDHLQFSIVIALLVCILLIVKEYFKISSFRLLNGYHSAGMDSFFTWFTYLGDGLFCCALILVLWISGRRLISYKLFAGFLISSLFVQVLKYSVRAARPREIISSQVYHNFIDGVTHWGFSSFPSGHATTAFTIAAIIALNTSNNILRFLVFIYALAVGYSRIYLAQHFVDDVLAGVVLGLITAKLVEYIFNIQLYKR